VTPTKHWLVTFQVTYRVAADTEKEAREILQGQTDMELDIFDNAFVSIEEDPYQ